MASFLSGSLAKQVNKAFASTFLDATLTRFGAATGDIYDPVDGASSTFKCKAINSTWSSGYLSGGLVASNDRQILVLTQSLKTVPQVGDRITIDGETLTISSDGGSMSAVSTDPAKAVWTLRARE